MSSREVVNDPKAFEFLLRYCEAKGEPVSRHFVLPFTLALCSFFILYMVGFISLVCRAVSRQNATCPKDEFEDYASCPQNREILQLI